MLRQAIAERPHWRDLAAEYGFHFHTMYGEPYWQEDAFYQFTLQQIEQDLEAPTAELHQMCLAVVDVVARDDEYLTRFAVPEAFWQPILDSWERQAPSLYSRLDLVYDGKHPAKLLENNADTPTSLYETAFWQWLWLEDNVKSGALPAHADQFNSLQEKLIHRFANLKRDFDVSQMHFTCCQDSIEDRGTVQYLQDCAHEAGMIDHFVFMEQMGLSQDGFFTDKLDRVVDWCFKLYPWENMHRDDFAADINNAQVNWLEPMYKSLLSNKALLPMLWKLFPNHPNLLPAYFSDELGHANGHGNSHGSHSADMHTGDWVKKPLYSREGANIAIIKQGQVTHHSTGPYGEEGYIYQAYHPLPTFEKSHTIIGSWLVDDLPAGISVREDTHPITQDMSRFLPHIIV